MTKTKTDTELSEEEVRAKRKELLDALADLPNPDAEKPGLTPGSIVGDGPSREKVAYTQEWYIANFPLKEVTAAETQTIRVNGVGFTVFKDIPCKLPEPHYAVYQDRLRRLRELDKTYAPPENPGRNAGYVSPVYKMGEGFFHTAEQGEKQ